MFVVTLMTGARSFAATTNDIAAPIFITGSRIPRADLTAVSPVTTIKGEQFKHQGATNAEELLNQLPQVNPSKTEFDLGGVTGTATVDLRGLGAVRTLILVNGHRLMPGDPRYSASDINSIPTSIIQRVEVLTGGAAAVYGSDAVAGVVNFILDTNIDGLKLDAQIGGYQHNNRDDFARALLDEKHLPYPKGSVFDGWRGTVSAAFGRSFFDGRAHVTLYGGYRQIEQVKQNRRDYSACPITARIIDQQPSDILECGGPISSYPGNFFDNLDNVYQVTPERTFVPGLSRFNVGPWNQMQRPDKRYTGGGFASFDFSEALQAYAEVMAMKDRTVWRIGPSGDFTNTETINCDNPLLSDQQLSLICRHGNFVGEIPTLDADGNLVNVEGTPTIFVDPLSGDYLRGWLLIALRNIESGPIEDDLRHKSIRVLQGVKGDLGRGITYDASYLYGRVSLNRQYRNNISITRMGRALDVVTDPSTGQPVCRSVLIARELGSSVPGADAGCVPWDVFAPSQVSPQAVAYLAIRPSMRGSFKEQVGNINATIQLDRWRIGSPWSDEGAAINLGAEVRKDNVDFDPDEFTETGDIAGFGEQVFPIRGSVTSKEVFGEARIPLITDKLMRRLAFEGAFRRSWYRNSRSDFSSDTYKLVLDLTPVSGWRFRASRQRAIRAPNILELLAPSQPDTFNRDPCAGATPVATAAQCARSGVTPAQYGHVTRANSNARFPYNAVLGGNEDLRPEAATTTTLGMVLQPPFMRGFNATIDWWDIKLNGAISTIGAQTIIDSCVASGDPIFCGRVHRAANGSLTGSDGYVDDRQANLGGMKVRGVDGSADYSLGLGRIGSASFDFRSAYVMRWIVDNGGLSTPYDCAGLFGTPCGMQPRWRHSARATWETPHGVSVSLQWRHVGGVKLAALDPRFNLTDEVSPANTKLRSQDYFDVAAVLRLKQPFELRIGVNNVLDRRPPLVVSNTAAGGGPFNADTYPGWYDPLGRYVFASLSVALHP